MSIFWAVVVGSTASVVVITLAYLIVRTILSDERLKSFELSALRWKGASLVNLKVRTHEPPPAELETVHEPRAVWFIGR